MNYRLTHYAYKHWQIEELKTPGEDAKNQEPYWTVIKYPGNLQNAAKGLLDLAMGEITTDSVETLTGAVKAAEKRILAAIEDVIVERKR